MKTSYCSVQSNYLIRTAIEAEILFAVCLSKKQALTGGKSLAREDKCSKKIGAVLMQQVDRIGAASKQARYHIVTQFGFEHKNLSNANYLELGLAFITGSIAGKLGGKGADSSHIMASSTKRLIHRIGNAITLKTGKDLVSELSKAIAYYGKTNGLKFISKDTVWSIVKGTIPSVLNLGIEIYKAVENMMHGEQ